MPSLSHKVLHNKANGLEEHVMSHALQRIDETREALIGALAERNWDAIGELDLGCRNVIDEVLSEAPVDERSDVYSWGRIFVHAATGELVERGSEDVANVEIPDALKALVSQCVAITRSQRPADMKAILKVLKGWQ